MARQETAKVLINRAAVECGLTASSDPFSTSDDSFTQLVGLLNAVGQELVELHEWQALREVFTFTVDLGTNATGIYDLPAAFGYMINQTGWDKTNGVSMGGPLSAQDWAYLDGRGLTSSSIYASFRQIDNKLYLYPQPPPDGLEVSFEYISRFWATDTSGATAKDEVTASSDIVLLEPILVVKFLKAKFKEAKGMDASSARMEFENMFLSRTGRDQGAYILNAAGSARGSAPLLSAFNTADTGYGVP